MLELSKLAHSTFYYYLQEKIDKYKVEKQEVEEIFYNSKNTYGYRRITLELRQKRYTINHKTVLKLINVLKIYGKQRRSKYKSYRGEVGKVAPNILNREFAADAPYTKLTTDVTEFSICNEKVYLSPVLDMYNNEILSYSISLSPNFWQTKEMLDGLFERLPKTTKPYYQSLPKSGANAIITQISRSGKNDGTPYGEKCILLKTTSNKLLLTQITIC